MNKLLSVLVLFGMLSLSQTSQANIVGGMGPTWYTHLQLVGNHLPAEQAYSHTCTLERSGEIRIVSRIGKTGESTYAHRTESKVALISEEIAELHRLMASYPVTPSAYHPTEVPYACGQEDMRLEICTTSPNGSGDHIHGLTIDAKACGTFKSWSDEIVTQTNEFVLRLCRAAINGRK